MRRHQRGVRQCLALKRGQSWFRGCLGGLLSESYSVLPIEHLNVSEEDRKWCVHTWRPSLKVLTTSALEDLNTVTDFIGCSEAWIVIVEVIVEVDTTFGSGRIYFSGLGFQMR